MRLPRRSLFYASFLWRLLAVEAFTTKLTSVLRASVTARSLHGDWDNDSYLDSLGQGQAEQNEADDDFGTPPYGRPEEQPRADPSSFDSTGHLSQQQPTQAAPQSQEFASYLDQQHPSPSYQQSQNQNLNQQMSLQEQTGVGFGQNVPQYPPQSPPPPQQQQGGFGNIGEQNPFTPPQQSTGFSYQQQPAQAAPQSQGSAYLDQQPLPSLQQQNQNFNQPMPPQEQTVVGFGQNAPQYPPQSPPPPQQQQGGFGNVGGQNTFTHPQQQQGGFVNAEAFTPPQNPSTEKDDIPTEDMEGAVFTDQMKAKIKASHTPEEEASQGGEKFRELMARAQKSAPVLQSAQAQQSVQIPPNAMNLSIEEQARLFREIMMQRQQPQQQQPTTLYSQQQTNPYVTPQQQQQMPNAYGQQTQPQTQYIEQQQQSTVYGQQPPNAYEQQMQAPSQFTSQQTQPNAYDQQMQQQTNAYDPRVTDPYTQQQQQPNPYSHMQQQNIPAPTAPDNYLPPGVGFDGRKIGRNRDADMISNTADVYLAQLKRDSTSRNIARYSGDTERANQVFHDPVIQDIEVPPENPYMKEQREKLMDMIETVPEEMLVFQEYGNEGDKSSSGISYREKIAQIKAQRSAEKKNSPS